MLAGRYLAMNTLAAGVSFEWHGIDGWLFFLAAVAFILACIAAIKPGRISNAMFWVSLGLLLWVITNIVRSLVDRLGVMGVGAAR